MEEDNGASGYNASTETASDNGASAHNASTDTASVNEASAQHVSTASDNEASGHNASKETASDHPNTSGRTESSVGDLNLRVHAESANRLQEHMYSQYQRRERTDCTIFTNDEVIFEVHRAVITVIPFFRTYFDHPVNKAKKEDILLVMKPVSSDCLAVIIDFAYGRDIEIHNMAFLEKLRKTCAYLGFTALGDQLEDFKRSRRRKSRAPRRFVAVEVANEDNGTENLEVGEDNRSGNLVADEDNGRENLVGGQDNGRENLMAGQDNGSENPVADEDHGSENLMAYQENGRENLVADEDNGRENLVAGQDNGSENFVSSEDNGSENLAADEDVEVKKAEEVDRREERLVADEARELMNTPRQFIKSEPMEMDESPKKLVIDEDVEEETKEDDGYGSGKSRLSSSNDGRMNTILGEAPGEARGNEKSTSEVKGTALPFPPKKSSEQEEVQLPSTSSTNSSTARPISDQGDQTTASITQEQTAEAFNRLMEQLRINLTDPFSQLSQHSPNDTPNLPQFRLVPQSHPSYSSAKPLAKGHSTKKLPTNSRTSATRLAGNLKRANKSSTVTSSMLSSLGVIPGRTQPRPSVPKPPSSSMLLRATSPLRADRDIFVSARNDRRSIKQRTLKPKSSFTVTAPMSSRGLPPVRASMSTSGAGASGPIRHRPSGPIERRTSGQMKLRTSGPSTVTSSMKSSISSTGLPPLRASPKTTGASGPMEQRTSGPSSTVALPSMPSLEMSPTSESRASDPIEQRTSGLSSTDTSSRHSPTLRLSSNINLGARRKHFNSQRTSDPMERRSSSSTVTSSLESPMPSMQSMPSVEVPPTTESRVSGPAERRASTMTSSMTSNSFRVRSNMTSSAPSTETYSMSTSGVRTVGNPRDGITSNQRSTSTSSMSSSVALPREGASIALPASPQPDENVNEIVEIPQEYEQSRTYRPGTFLPNRPFPLTGSVLSSGHVPPTYGYPGPTQCHGPHPGPNQFYLQPPVYQELSQYHIPHPGLTQFDTLPLGHTGYPRPPQYHMPPPPALARYLELHQSYRPPPPHPGQNQFHRPPPGHAGYSRPTQCQRPHSTTHTRYPGSSHRLAPPHPGQNQFQGPRPTGPGPLRSQRPRPTSVARQPASGQPASGHSASASMQEDKGEGADPRFATLTCQVCGIGIEGPDALLEHMLLHEREKLYEALYPNEVSASAQEASGPAQDTSAHGASASVQEASASAQEEVQARIKIEIEMKKEEDEIEMKKEDEEIEMKKEDETEMKKEGEDEIEIKEEWK